MTNSSTPSFNKQPDFSTWKITELGIKHFLAQGIRKVHIPQYLVTLEWSTDSSLGHKGDDGRYYVLDFARTFPPEGKYFSPLLCYWNFIDFYVAPTTNRRTIFYLLLRPELVRQWETPLNSDAFSGITHMHIHTYIHINIHTWQHALQHHSNINSSIPYTFIHKHSKVASHWTAVAVLKIPFLLFFFQHGATLTQTLSCIIMK